MSTEPPDVSKSHDESSAAEPARVDAAQLVKQLIASGEWPSPVLLEQILAAGEAAVEPLREVARLRPGGWPQTATVDHAIGLLGGLGARSAIPELRSAARDYLGRVGHTASRALAHLGKDGFETLLDLIRDPNVVGQKRQSLITGAAVLAAEERPRQEQFAEALREVFSKVLQEARSAAAFEEELVGESPGENLIEPPDSDQDPFRAQGPDVWTPLVATTVDHELVRRHAEEAENELLPSESLAFLADHLSRIADPQARQMIQSAFDDGWIDEGIIDRQSFLDSYEKGGSRSRPLSAWLDGYRELYQEHQELQANLARLNSLNFPARASYPTLPPREPLIGNAKSQDEPIRNAGQRIGRNDPCWCGSGKKYKKCHFGKDGSS